MSNPWEEISLDDYEKHMGDVTSSFYKKREREETRSLFVSDQLYIITLTN